MKNNAYLAMYKAKGNWVDTVIRFFTRSQYSHCEIAVKRKDGTFNCYSSSPRDGGVRMKKMDLSPHKWDLIPLKTLSKSYLKRFYNQTQGRKYDFMGAIGIVIPFIKQKSNRYFCSEWAAEVLKRPKPYQYSPAKLAQWAEKE